MKNIYSLSGLRSHLFCLFIFLSIAAISCNSNISELPPSDKDNGGLILPGGFEALVVIDSIGGGSVIAKKVRQLSKSAIYTPPPELKGAPKSTQLSRPNNQPVGNYVGARHLAVNDNGDIYVKLRTPTTDGFGNAALRDVNGGGGVYIADFES